MMSALGFGPQVPLIQRETKVQYERVGQPPVLVQRVSPQGNSNLVSLEETPRIAIRAPDSSSGLSLTGSVSSPIPLGPSWSVEGGVASDIKVADVSPQTTAPAVEHYRAVMARDQVRIIAVHRPKEDSVAQSRLLKRALGLTPRKLRMLKTTTSKRGNKGRLGPALPPDRLVSVVTDHTFRFSRVTNDGSSNITYGNIFGMLGTICSVANSTVKCIASAYRIRWLAVYPAAPAVTGNSNTCEVAWYGDNTEQTPDFDYDTSLPSGITSGNILVSRPPKNSLAGDWVNNTVSDLTAVLFTLTAPRGSILDVNVEFTLCADLSSISRTVTTATLGVMYYLGLDGAGALWPPKGLPTTV